MKTKKARTETGGSNEITKNTSKINVYNQSALMKKHII